MNHDNLTMTEEDHNRLRAKRAANRAVVTRIIDESEEILEYDSTPQDDVRSKNRLIRILTMLKEKMELLIDLDGKTLDGVKVDDITKEIEEAEFKFFKMKIMDAIANIKSSNTLSAKLRPLKRLIFLIRIHRHLIHNTNLSILHTKVSRIRNIKWQDYLFIK